MSEVFDGFERRYCKLSTNLLRKCTSASALCGEAAHGKKLPSAVVVGTVYCETCFQDGFSKTSHFISGASVAVECGEGSSNSKPSFQKEVKTDKHGEFKVQLPFSVSKHVKKIKGCSVKLIRSSEPHCAVASTATSSSIHLKSRKQGSHIFSAGFFTFKPLKQPNMCNQKPSIENSRGVNTMKFLLPPTDDPVFLPPIQDPTLPNLPPLPLLPNLPPLPPLPGVPSLPPVPKNNMHSNSKSTESSKVYHPDFFFPTPQIPFLPPNPLQPPSILPPNPLLPPPLLPNPLQPPPLLPNPLQPPPLLPNPLQPAPAPLIPNPLQPPPAPFIPLPPIPGLTPSPPPPSPTIPFPFPPITLPPTPLIPGIPPASSSPVKTSP